MPMDWVEEIHRKERPALIAAIERLDQQCSDIYWVIFNIASQETIEKQFVSGNLPWRGAIDKRIALVYFADGPINAAHVLSIRNHICNVGAECCYIATSREDLGADVIEQALRGALLEAGWLPATQEEVGIKVGSRVRTTPCPEAYDSGMLTIKPSGRMSEVLDELDAIKREWLSIKKPDKFDRTKWTKELHDHLNKSAGPLRQYDWDSSIRARIPRVLLLGESGSGKTLVAQYLSKTASQGTDSFGRISLPEYLESEDKLEFDLFGHTKDAYTGADSGNVGILMNHIGGVVFLDEIGDASPALQAKLLAYLDDYKFRPRGWSGEPLFCPALIVAATNKIDFRDCKWGITENAKGVLRQDLLERFTKIIHVPSLKERLDEFDYVLDAFIQQILIRHPQTTSTVKGISNKALEDLRKKIEADGLKNSNFRGLERLLVEACARARRQRCNILQSSHLPLLQGF